MARKTIILRVLQVYWRATRSLTMGAQAAVFDAQGRVLLVRHTYRPGWHFPGGGVERGQTVLSAVVRELDEEACVRPLGVPKLFSVYANFQSFPSDHVVLYVVDGVTTVRAFKSNREIAEAQFFERGRLPDGTADAVHARLAEIFDGVVPSEAW